MNKITLALFLKIAAVLWIVWGLVHVFAGGITVYLVSSGDISAAVGGIADAMGSAAVQRDYPAATGAILGQHGFNLAWIGLSTLICAPYIWKKNGTAIFIAALVGGLADLGYFLFLDLGGFVNFVPGTVMTLVSATAIILSFTAYFRSDKMAAFRL